MLFVPTPTASAHRSASDLSFTPRTRRLNSASDLPANWKPYFGPPRTKPAASSVSEVTVVRSSLPTWFHECRPDSHAEPRAPIDPRRPRLDLNAVSMTPIAPAAS